MAVELVTGQGADDHIGPEDFGAYNAYTYGPDRYILHGCEAQAVDANTIRISEGEMLIDGRHYRVKGSEDIKIQSGAVDRNRCDLIAIRYRKDAEGVEDAPMEALPGTPTEGTPISPAYTEGSILAGDVAVDVPIYSITVNGLSVGEPKELLPRSESLKALEKELWDCLSQKMDANAIVPVNRGGTGRSAIVGNSSLLRDMFDTTLNDAGYIPVFTESWADGGYQNIKQFILRYVYPVGAVYLSYTNNSPASWLGGTWTQITGRVLRMANDVSTGGSDTHTHSMTSGAALMSMSGTGIYYQSKTSSTWNSNYLSPSNTHSASTTSMSDGMAIIGNTGSTTNLPVYQDLYAWRRTA